MVIAGVAFFTVIYRGELIAAVRADPFDIYDCPGCTHAASACAASQASMSESGQREHPAENFTGFGNVFFLTQRQIVDLLTL